MNGAALAVTQNLHFYMAGMVDVCFCIDPSVTKIALGLAGGDAGGLDKRSDGAAGRRGQWCGRVPAGDGCAGCRTPSRTVPFQRYILPEGSLGLTGEFEDRLWSVYLTAQQAASGAKLNLGYQNSIFVAPETSRLTVEVNNTKIAEEAIRSPESVSDLSLDLPKDLLKPGSNLIRLRSSQRHRTDCDVQSTYELWSNVDAEKTFLSFTGNDPVSMQSLDDIKAIGVDEGGLTRFNFVVPALKQPVSTIPLMRLSQGLAVLADMPNQSFSFETSKLTPSGPGEMTVLVGTSAELSPLLASLPMARPPRRWPASFRTPKPSRRFW